MKPRFCTNALAYFALIVSLCGAGPSRVAVTAQLYSHGDPTAEEQLMLELINRARMNPAAEAVRFDIDLNEGLSPDQISSTPKQPLAFNPYLIQAARGHSTWMLSADIFSHTGSNGSSPGDRMKGAGYTFSGSWTWGENIAWQGTTASTIPVGPSVIEMHQGLFVDTAEADRGHRLNLLNSSFREIGVGVGTGIFTQNGKGYTSVMVTQDFAASQANPGPFLIGVAYRDLNGDGSYSVGEGLAGVTIAPVGSGFEAMSSTSGGYAIPITGLSGILQVTFSGGPLSGPLSKSIALTGNNVKLDFELNADSAPSLGFVPGSLRYSAPGQFEADLRGSVNTRVSIQGSDNLATWTEISRVALSATGAHFTDTSGGSVRRYYRAVKL